MNTFSTIMDVRIVPSNGDPLQVDYDPKTIMDSKQAYVFSRVEPHYRSIIYVVGAQSRPYRKMMAAQHAVLSLKQIVGEVSRSANVYFTRKTSDSLRTFGDVEKWESVSDKIPRLYCVGIGGIVQLPMKPQSLNNKTALVLHDGSDVTVYYPYSLSNEIIKIAKSFATYIDNFQKRKYNVVNRISILEGQKKFKKFVIIIKNSLNVHLHNKINSIQKNDMVNFETINEKLDEKISIVDDKDNEEYEKLKTLLHDMLENIIFAEESARASDERISSSFTDSVSLSSTSSASSSTASNFTASTSTGCARRKVKRKTTRKGKKKSCMKSQSVNVAIFPKNYDITILGPAECEAVKTYPIDAIKPTCVYVILDLINGESVVYFGRYGRELDYKRAVTIAEVFLNHHRSCNVSYIVDDDHLVPPFFMIYFKNELEKYLGMSF